MLRSAMLLVLLLGTVGFSTWAGPILQSDEPIPVTGYGAFGWNPSGFTGGFDATGQGTNGVDFIAFSVGASLPFFPGQNLSGEHFGSQLYVNGIHYAIFSYTIGGANSEFRVLDPDTQTMVTIPLIAWVEITSFNYVPYPPGQQTGWEGTFSIASTAPVPEPATFGLVVLMLGVGYFGVQRNHRK